MVVYLASRCLRFAAATAAVAAALAALSGCAGGQQAPVLAAPAGSAGLLATSQGVIWSFPSGDQGTALLRSPDHGRHWRIVLPGTGQTSGLAASFFLGPGTAWVVRQHLTSGRDGERVVLGTTDGGQTWWRSDPLPGHVTVPDFVPYDQLYFTDAQHGWLLASGARLAGRGMVRTTLLWATTDGGHVWTRVPRAGMPLQGWSPVFIGTHDGGCFDDPAIAFANPADGWLTMGACGPATSGPQVWRTSDGGRHWAAVTLAAPGGGWARWIAAGDTGPSQTGSDAGRVHVGQARLVASGIGATVLVPVAIGRSGLLIEQSRDAGQTWHIAGQVHTGALPITVGPAAWFDPINSRQWVITAPGWLIETADDGRHWTYRRATISQPGVPSSFTSLGHGFVQGSGEVADIGTWDHGRKWVIQRAPPWTGTDALAVGPAVSAVQFASGGLTVAAGSAGVLTSADGGRTWTTRLAAPAPVSQVDVVSAAVSFAVAEGDVLRSTDGGMSWQPADPPVAGPVVNVSFWTASDGVADVRAADGYLYFRTADAGRHWTPLRLPPGWSPGPGGLAGDQFVPSSACFAPGGAGWLVASRGGGNAVLSSTDGGLSWRVALPPATLGTATAGLAGCAGRDAWVLAARAGSRGGPEAMTYDLLRSTDAGRTWLDMLRTGSGGHPAVPLSPGQPLPPAGLHPAALFEQLALGRAGSVWLTFADTNAGGGLYLAASADDGLDWSWHLFPAARDGQPTLLARMPPGARWLGTAALDARHALALFTTSPQAGLSYLFATSDGGATWRPVTELPPGSAR